MLGALADLIELWVNPGRPSPATRAVPAQIGQVLLHVMADLVPRVSGTICAFMQRSPLRPGYDDVEALGWRAPRSQTGPVEDLALALAVLGGVRRSVVDA